MKARNNYIYIFLFIFLTIFLISMNVFATDYPVFHSDVVTDIDGNSYDAVQIDNGTFWFKSNLITTKDVDNNSLDTMNAVDRGGTETGNIVYSTDEIIADDICPSGWHIPTQDDWQKLIDYVGDIDDVDSFFYNNSLLFQS